MATRKRKQVTDAPFIEDAEDTLDAGDIDRSDLLEDEGPADEAGPSELTSEEAVELAAGTVRDYVTGKRVRATPEEVQAVQVFARRLVEDYGYPRELLTTHPQHRVRERPSDEDRSYPVDIAVFSDTRKLEDQLSIIVECKKKTRTDGIGQLKAYMRLSSATVGVWFNGQDHAYIRKIYGPDGTLTWEDLPNIPKYGQRVEDIGLYLRKDLKPASNLKAIFRDLRNHLAGNLTGITRDEQLAREIINVLFCKIYDEAETGPEETVTFRSGVGEDPADVQDRILALFGKVKEEYADVFDDTDAITLDAESLVYIVGELQPYCLTEADRDAIGDAFEVFIGPALRGPEGQFFTPRNVVKMMVDILDPQPGELVLDPACGSGGFLVIALTHVWSILDKQAKTKGWNAVQLALRKRDVASKFFRGIEKDSFLAKVTKAYMAIVGDGRGGICCDNSLLPPKDWKPGTQSVVKLGTFDIVITNPPYGKKIRIKGQSTLAEYKLGHKWKFDKALGKSVETKDIRDDQVPQLLFLERCLQLLKPGGRMGIVLPEAVFGLPSYEPVITFLRENARITGIVSMPEALFKTSGKGGTHTKTCVAFIEKTVPQPGEEYPIFMADAKWCGHDSRGNPTIQKNAHGKPVLLDDIPEIAKRYNVLMGRS